MDLIIKRGKPKNNETKEIAGTRDGLPVGRPKSTGSRPRSSAERSKTTADSVTGGNRWVRQRRRGSERRRTREKMSAAIPGADCVRSRSAFGIKKEKETNVHTRYPYVGQTYIVHGELGERRLRRRVRARANTNDKSNLYITHVEPQRESRVRSTPYIRRVFYSIG